MKPGTKKTKKRTKKVDVSKPVCVVCRHDIAVIGKRCCTCYYDCP